MDQMNLATIKEEPESENHPKNSINDDLPSFEIEIEEKGPSNGAADLHMTEIHMIK